MFSKIKFYGVYRVSKDVHKYSIVKRQGSASEKVKGLYKLVMFISRSRAILTGFSRVLVD